MKNYSPDIEGSVGDDSLLPRLVATANVVPPALVGDQPPVGLHNDRVEVLDAVDLKKKIQRFSLGKNKGKMSCTMAITDHHLPLHFTHHISAHGIARPQRQDVGKVARGGAVLGHAAAVLGQALRVDHAVEGVQGSGLEGDANVRRVALHVHLADQAGEVCKKRKEK